MQGQVLSPAMIQVTVNSQIHPTLTVQEILELIKNSCLLCPVTHECLWLLFIIQFDDLGLGYQLLYQIMQSMFV